MTQASSDVGSTYIALFFTFLNKLYPNQCSMAPYHGYKRTSPHIFAISEKSIRKLIKNFDTKRKFKIRVFRSCFQNLKNLIFIGQTTQNKPKITYFLQNLRPKMADFGSVLSFLAYKNHVFKILKTVPEYSYFQLSFAVKIFYQNPNRFFRNSKNVWGSSLVSMIRSQTTLVWI